MAARLLDLTGRKFGRLTVIKQAGNSDSGSAMWLCQCECGETRVIESGALRHLKRPACSRYCVKNEDVHNAKS